MRAGRRTAAACTCGLALLALTLAGCPALLSDDFHLGGSPATDAGVAEVSDDASGLEASAADATLDDATLDDAPNGDGGPIDAAPPVDATLEADAPEPTPCCTARTDPLDQATFDAWAPEGVTKPFPAFVELTPEKLQQAAALLAPDPAPVGDFDMSFQFSITKTRDAGNAADGLAFVALTSVAGPCDAGSNLCLIGTSSGFALVVRTYRFATEPPAPYIALVDTSHPIFLPDAGPVLLGGKVASFDGGIVTYVADASAEPPSTSWETLCMHAAAGVATVKLNGATILSGVPVPGMPSAHWGFVGATGGSSQRNAIRDLQIIGTPVCGDAAACVDAGVCGN
jgi:hypothetical protein